MFGPQYGSTRERPSERKLYRNLVYCILIFLSSCHRYMNALEKQLGFQGQRAYGIPWNAAIRYGILIDTRDGGTYRIVKIGEQTWMAQNLDYKMNGSWCLDRVEDSCRKYGRAYQWTTAMDIGRIYLDTNLGGLDGPYRGICPIGWHLPSNEDWEMLMTSVGGKTLAGLALKSTAGWMTEVNEDSLVPGHQGTDVSGFRALPADYSTSRGEPLGAHRLAFFWSTSESDRRSAWTQSFDGSTNEGTLQEMDKSEGFGVRCVQDPR